MAMSAKLVKLDQRHKGHSEWQYMVESRLWPSQNRVKEFCTWREWCWQQWGASKELDEFDHYDLFDGKSSSNPYWCWLGNSPNHGRRIYFRTQAEATAFSLFWLM